MKFKIKNIVSATTMQIEMQKFLGRKNNPGKQKFNIRIMPKHFQKIFERDWSQCYQYIKRQLYFVYFIFDRLLCQLNQMQTRGFLFQNSPCCLSLFLLDGYYQGDGYHVINCPSYFLCIQDRRQMSWNFSLSLRNQRFDQIQFSVMLYQEYGR